MYSTEQFLIEKGNGGTVRLSVIANSGQLLVETPCGDQWLPALTYTEDTVVDLSLGNGSTRFTPSGGAVFEIV